ncbi:host-nuclease inhibitor Gam family protein [Limosilactobacillus reuteri]|uniref:host-nuclease inhibitor Gam family protein n=1 Tax=Limosilactobacillus reuteri TaxID=1598 RepID=UPI001E5D6F92|nr:host-nuclease inhibitor Gam family protein [Limosilactobacillus reuteri]MCC4518315.1 host-nuclease inhibitor Gam family protein [Limosilactobacillus reuteri]
MTEETMTKGTEELNKMVANATANQEEKERFSIENDDQLKWAFQMMEEKRKEIRAKKDMIQQAIDYYEGQIKDLRKDIDYFKGLAMQYAEEQADEDPNWSFKESPYGRIIRKKEKTDLVVSDEQALINHLKGTEFVEHVEEDKLKWGDLKKTLSTPDGEHVVNDDGELVDDVTVVTNPSVLVMKHKNAKDSWVEKED